MDTGKRELANGVIQRVNTGMGLAPPFTRENAAENARKAVIAREENRHIRKMAMRFASKDFTAVDRAKRQIERVMNWMDETNSKEEFCALASTLDRLWNKAFPTQGAVKSSRQRDRVAIPVAPVETPISDPPTT